MAIASVNLRKSGFKESKSSLKKEPYKGSIEVRI